MQSKPASFAGSSPGQGPFTERPSAAEGLFAKDPQEGQYQAFQTRGNHLVFSSTAHYSEKPEVPDPLQPPPNGICRPDFCSKQLF